MRGIGTSQEKKEQKVESKFVVSGTTNIEQERNDGPDWVLTITRRFLPFLPLESSLRQAILSARLYIQQIRVEQKSDGNGSCTLGCDGVFPTAILAVACGHLLLVACGTCVLAEP